MIWHTRTASLLLIAFSLFTSAVTVYAECAWVLWNQMVVMAPSLTPGQASDPFQRLHWETLSAYGTRDACQQALNTGEERRKAEFEEMKKENRLPPLVSVKLVCLPDTVDPRGPKGK